MKKIIIALAICLATTYNNAYAQQIKKATKKATTTASTSKDKDGVDGRMKGPNGEVVYIGEKGGRYYVNTAGNKVYVALKKKKK